MQTLFLLWNFFKQLFFFSFWSEEIFKFLQILKEGALTGMRKWVHLPPEEQE